jgi:hypothetical protein
MNFSSSTLYQLFSSLNAEELKELDKAVRSPFFNYRREEILLYEYLLKTKKAKTTIISAEDAYKHVFPQQLPDLARLRHVMTYLTRIINRYITIREMEKDEVQQRLLQTQAMRKRNLPKLFLAGYREAEAYLSDTAPISPANYYHQLQLHTEYYSHSISNRRAENNDLQRLTDDLDSFYITQKLKHICSILSYKNIFHFEYQPELAEEIIQMTERKNLLQNPLVRLLYFNYLCLSEPDNEDYFLQLKEALLHHSARIEIKELKDIFTLAINYCIRRLNTGGQKYFIEVFNIYKAGLERGIFEEDGYLSPFTYKNITAIAIGLKAYEWVAGFIETYKARLAEDIRDGFYAYCKARYFFSLGKFDSVTGLLQEVEIKEQFTDLDARVLLIKTYFELDEYNLLGYGIENLKQQLKRKKLQTYHETVYGSFARMALQLSHLRPYDKQARERFKTKVETTRAIAEKDWLLSKVK